MAAAMYSNRPGAHYGYPQPPPSPPMDDTAKCSLPSISNLLVMADAGSPTSESSPPQSHHSGMGSDRPSRLQHGTTYAKNGTASSTKVDTRPNSSHYSSNGHSRTAALPPTPPLSSEAFHPYSPPSTKPLTQEPALPGSANFYYETTPPVEDVHRQQHMSSAASRLPAQAQSYSPQAYTSNYLNPSPMPAYYPSTLPTAQSQMPGIYYQRPLPQTFPSLPVAVSLAPSSGANPWQHHHYISPSSAASFPQSQDRYICQTCNKAFSRPSSLRIHSHSHTGEKPFKCPHAGCGKAFSVRSNMKRHERGCHSFNSSGPSLR
ncbi:hypothetical protein GGS20DRAFT_260068 [Poronia punctata]|nr:hypothetical protein GGS20DRAFT_260068 [Poronia punctata]